MKDANHVSRRQSLKGIAATGAFIAGAGLSAGTAAAGSDEKGPKWLDTVDFCECHAAYVVLDKKISKKFRKRKKKAKNGNNDINGNNDVNGNHGGMDGFPKWIRITFYDARRKRFGLIWVPIIPKRLRTLPSRYGKRLVYEFNLYQYLRRHRKAPVKIASVAVDGASWRNENSCAKKIPDEVDGGRNEKKEKKKGGEDRNADPTDLTFEAVSSDDECGLARFRVDNAGPKPATVSYDVYTTGNRGKLSVLGKSSTYFDVHSLNGKSPVTLRHRGSEIGVESTDVAADSVPREHLWLEPLCRDTWRGKAKYRFINTTDEPLTMTWRVPETGKRGLVTADHATEFWVDAPNGDTTVEMAYEGEPLARESSERAHCEGKPSPKRVEMDGVCYTENKKGKRKAVFEIANENDSKIHLKWTEKKGDDGGKVTVRGEDSTHLKVPFEGRRKPVVSLYYEGKKITTEKAAMVPCKETNSHNGNA